MSTLLQTSGLYDLAARWEADRMLVEHAAIEQFSASVAALLQALGDDENYWAGVSRPLKGLRWRMATVPLPLNHTAIRVQETADAVVPRLRRCKHLLPDLAPLAEHLADQLEHFCASEDDPLGDAARQVAADTGPATVLLLIDGNCAKAVGAAFGDSFRAMTTGQLLRSRAGLVIATGPFSWFPRSLLQAPRAEQFTFAYFGWLRDRNPDLDLLIGTEKRLRQALAPAPERQVAAPVASQQDAGAWVPRIEWKAVARAAQRVDASGESVAAQLFLLASGEGVYLESRDRATAFVADLEYEVSVGQMRVADISVGTFLVVRTQGDGDYVRDLADRLLGQRSQHLRDLQRRIKRNLAAEITKDGTAEVARRLTRLGSPIANENNLRRWASSDSIRTHDFADFSAICELIEERNPKWLWDAMGELQAAHQQAGNEVRKLLVGEIRKADGAVLLQQGWADYDVEEIEGEGNLRVARVTGRAPDEAEVPRSRLRRAFPVQGDLWLG